MQNISMIVAMDQNQVIGKGGKVPWRLSADIRHFADTTKGKTVLMGRKTYESLPVKYRPLPGRQNIVLTRDSRFVAPGCGVLHSVTDILKVSIGLEVYIMGGGEVYSLLMPYTYRLIVTKVNTQITGGDAFFPQITDEWRAREISRHQADDKNQFSFSIVEYVRR